VFNPPAAVPIVLSRQEPHSAASSGGSSSSSSGQLRGPESIKACYALTPNSLALLRGVTREMGGRGGGVQQQAAVMAWRPYLKQVQALAGVPHARQAAVLGRSRGCMRTVGSKPSLQGG
jgi:hypothetical protein